MNKNGRKTKKRMSKEMLWNKLWEKIDLLGYGGSSRAKLIEKLNKVDSYFEFVMLDSHFEFVMLDSYFE
jgi:hypothetical protein